MRKTLLQSQCSLFKPYQRQDGRWCFSTIPVAVNFKDMLTVNHQGNLVDQIRQLPYKSEAQAQLKARLYGITPSSIQIGGRGEKYHAMHTGFIQYDIDHIDGMSMSKAELFDVLCSIPYTAYCALSASGNGFWGLMPISKPEMHKQHFDAMMLAFKDWGIDIDIKPRNVASLRFLSFDPNAYFNETAEVFDKVLHPKSSTYETKSNGRIRGNASAQSNPWREFNKSADFDLINEILTSAGWQYHSTKGEKVRYTRPGKDVSAGLSADYHTGRRTFYVFSSEAPEATYFIDKNGGSASDILLHYAAGGDKKLAYQILKQLNY